MTSNNSAFKEFSDRIEFYQSPTTGTSTRSPTTKNINNNYVRRCLQCKIQLSSSNLGPYCSTTCMSQHDAGIHGATTKERDSNIMRHFSEVFSQ